MRVATHDPQRRRIHQVHVIRHDVPESRVRSSPDKFCEPVLTLCHTQSPVKGRSSIKPNKKKAPDREKSCYTRKWEPFLQSPESTCGFDDPDFRFRPINL